MGGILLIVVALAISFIVLWKRDSRSLANAFVFGFLLAFGYLLFMELAFRSGIGGYWFAYLTLALFVGVPLLYFVGSVLLILNGRTMIRNEGLSFSHLLSPLVGAVPILFIFAVVCLLIVEHLGGEVTATVGTTLLTIAVGLYGYLIGIAYLTIPYGVVYTLFPRKPDADFIIIHGSGLINGKVPPLLASRLEKAIEVYNAGGSTATLIPSGGQGADESRSEASAMAEYLIAKGIPPKNVVPEAESATTYENMANSKRIIEQRSQAPGKVLFVTSNYHVFRTALIARKVGLDAHGIGSRTAGYYLPSAIIREFIAITVMHKWWYIAPVAVVALGILLLAALEAIL